MSPPPIIWTDLRERGVRHFGQAPSNQLESELLDLFKRNGERFSTVLDTVIKDFAGGDVRNPWPVVRHRFELADTQRQKRDDRHATDLDDEQERKQRAIVKAEQYVNATGWQVPTVAQIEDELFGRRGRLRAYRGDTALRDRMTELWRSVRTARAAEGNPEAIDEEAPASQTFRAPDGERGGQTVLDTGDVRGQGRVNPKTAARQAEREARRA